MLKRFVSTVIYNQQSFRLFNTSVIRLGDGDHTESKAKQNAANDLKTGREKRWLDTVASDSEAAVKGDRKEVGKGDVEKDVDELQRDTVNTIHKKQAKGHLPQHDVGRRDTHEERVGSGSGDNKKKK